MTIEKTPPRKATKCKVLKSGLVLTMGASLIIGTGTLAGFFERQTIAPQGTEITAGNLLLNPAAEGTWALNGAPIADLKAVRLVPGDQLTYTRTASPSVTGEITGYLYFKGLEELNATLAPAKAAQLAWSLDGARETKVVTPATSSTSVDAALSLTMKPVGDPIYQNGSEGEGLVVDVSRISLAFSIVNAN